MGKTLKTKIILGFVLVFIIMGVISASIIVNNIFLIKEQERSKMRVNNLLLGSELLKCLTDQEIALRGFIITKDEGFLEHYYGSYNKFKELISRIKHRKEGGVTHRILKEILNTYEEWQKNFATPINAMVKDGRVQDAVALVKSQKGKRLVHKFRYKIRELHDIQKKRFFSSLDNIKKKADSLIYITLFGTAFAILIGILIATYTARTFTKRINEVALGLKDISEKKGDLTKRIQVKTDDEAGYLTRQFNAIIEYLSELIKRIVDYVVKLSSSSSQIASTSEEMSRGAESQLNHVLKTSSAMEEMSATIKEISRNAIDTANSARAAVESAMKGSKKIKDAIYEISVSNDVIMSLSQQAEKVEKVIKLINDIASQTNILSINAAIEASRAGEYGKGFEVVAEEIRKLAQRTSESTEEISKTITDMIDGVERAKTSMDKTTKMAEESGEILDDIGEGITSTSEMVQNISSASSQQAKVSEEISKALQEISSISRQTTEGVKELSKAIQELNIIAQELKDISAQFRLK